jgi:anti-sigma factor RsiW
MNCFACEKNISAYIDDELTQDTRIEMESHLSDCDACRDEYESQLSTWEAVADVGSAPAPDNLWRGIETELEQTGHVGTTIDDLALIVRGLADEVRQLRLEVRGLQHEVDDRSYSEADMPVSDSGERRVRPRPGLSIWTEPGTGRSLSDVG